MFFFTCFCDVTDPAFTSESCVCHYRQLLICLEKIVLHFRILNLGCLKILKFLSGLLTQIDNSTAFASIYLNMGILIFSILNFFLISYSLCKRVASKFVKQQSYTAKNPTDLMQVADFVGFMQFAKSK